MNCKSPGLYLKKEGNMNESRNILSSSAAAEPYVISLSGYRITENK